MELGHELVIAFLRHIFHIIYIFFGAKVTIIPQLSLSLQKYFNSSIFQFFNSSILKVFR